MRRADVRVKKAVRELVRARQKLFESHLHISRTMLILRLSGHTFLPPVIPRFPPSERHEFNAFFSGGKQFYINIDILLILIV
jgi:hypothetical protein